MLILFFFVFFAIALQRGGGIFRIKAEINGLELDAYSLSQNSMTKGTQVVCSLRSHIQVPTVTLGEI